MAVNESGSMFLSSANAKGLKKIERLMERIKEDKHQNVLK